MNEATVEVPVYKKVLYKGPPEHATPLWLVSCDEGWRQSIVCEGMYEWAADWLLTQILGKPFAPENRPDRKQTATEPRRKTQPRICVGYPLGNGCTKPAGCAHTLYWCEECNERRMAAIGEKLENLARTERRA